MKKYIPYLLAGYFFLMIAAPGYLVYRHYNTLRTGESYKVEVEPYDPYDPFRGRYVALSTSVPNNNGHGKYALLDKDSRGYAIITHFDEKTVENGVYVKNLRLDRYYMNEKMALEAERLQREMDLSGDSMYLLVRVKNGHYVIQGLYVNDITIEEYITVAE